MVLNQLGKSKTEKKQKNSNIIYKPWLTKGIKTSCNRKRELYLMARDNKEIKLKLYYKEAITKSKKQNENHMEYYTQRKR